jgi:hypothetical protein
MGNKSSAVAKIHDSSQEDHLIENLKLENKLCLSLIDQMFPPHISYKLLQGLPIEPETFHNVGIFFSDIEGYTRLSTEISATKLLKFMHKLYSIIDECASCFNVYKLETIGDGYLLVSGFPQYNEKYMEEISEFALLVLQAIYLSIIYIYIYNNNKSISNRYI